MKYTNIITEVNPEIEKWLNHGQRFIVWYKTLNFYTGCTQDIRAKIFNNELEAIEFKLKIEEVKYKYDTTIL